MTPLNASDEKFLTARKALQRFGMFAFPAAVVLVLLIWIGLFYFVPLIVNPFHVLGRLEERSLAPGTLTVFAVVGVLAVNALFFLMAVLSVIGMLIARRERRYLRMIDLLQRPTESQGAAAPAAQR
jgi:hypothetical protein